MKRALQEEGCHIGKHSQDAHQVVDPIAIRDGAVGRLVPDGERQMNAEHADHNVQPCGPWIGEIDGKVAEEEDPLHQEQQ